MKNNTIINTDALVALRQLPNESIDCVVTDCPYLIAHRSTSLLSGILQAEAVRSGKMFEHNDIKFSEWLPEVYRVLKKGTHCYIMINSRNIKKTATRSRESRLCVSKLISVE